MKKKIHIGQLICRKLKAEGRSKRWLAEQVFCDQSNFCKILDKGSIDTDLLMRISLALHENFFLFLSENYIDNQQDTLH